MKPNFVNNDFLKSDEAILNEENNNKMIDDIDTYKVTKAEWEELNRKVNSIFAHVEDTSSHINISDRKAIDSKETPKGAQAKADAVQFKLDRHTNNMDLHVSKAEKAIFSDKYTRNEVDNKIANQSMFINWKSVEPNSKTFWAKYGDLPAKEGDFVVIKDEGIAFRYTNNKWQEFRFNVYPLATETVDGLMSAANYQKLESIEFDANHYIHPDGPEYCHVSQSQIQDWSNKADRNIVTEDKPGLMSPKMLKSLNSIINSDGNVTAKDAIENTVRYDNNVMYIGPKGSGANYIYDNSEGLDDIINNILNNTNCTSICIYNGEYKVFNPIVINKPNISIIGYGGCTIVNAIPNMKNPKEFKELRFCFKLEAKYISISNINFVGLDSYDQEVYQYCFKKDNGAILINNSSYCIISGCTFLQAPIVVYGCDNKIYNNEFKVFGKEDFAIGIGSTMKISSAYNIISDNIIEKYIIEFSSIINLPYTAIDIAAFVSSVEETIIHDNIIKHNGRISQRVESVPRNSSLLKNNIIGNYNFE